MVGDLLAHDLFPSDPVGSYRRTRTRRHILEVIPIKYCIADDAPPCLHARQVGIQDEEEVAWLVGQGFRRVVVGYAPGLPECVRAKLAAQSVEVIDAFSHDQSLLALLPQVMQL